MSTLYDIDAMFRDVVGRCREYAEDHGGELSADLSAEVDALEMVREKKIESCIAYFKNEKALADMIEQELDGLKRRIKTHLSNADFIKSILQGIVSPGEKVEYGCGKISWRASTAVKVLSESKLPETCFKVVREVSKTSVKEGIESGVIPADVAVMESHNNLQIK